MRNNPNSFANTIMSFIGLGIFIVLLVCAFVVFSYIFIIGAIIGLILFVIGYIRARFFARKQKISSSRSSHRIIDQDK